ncbi:MAG: hypothetical protein NVS9B15_25550 [Acidobacteriaceae bacterium]
MASVRLPLDTEICYVRLGGEFYHRAQECETDTLRVRKGAGLFGRQAFWILGEGDPEDPKSWLWISGEVAKSSCPKCWDEA